MQEQEYSSQPGYTLRRSGSRAHCSRPGLASPRTGAGAAPQPSPQAGVGSSRPSLMSPPSSSRAGQGLRWWCLQQSPRRQRWPPMLQSSQPCAASQPGAAAAINPGRAWQGQGPGRSRRSCAGASSHCPSLPRSAVAALVARV